MKRKTNKLLAALLSAIIVFGTAVSVSAYASDKSPDTGVETYGPPRNPRPKSAPLPA